jgi:hypothetical protein
MEKRFYAFNYIKKYTFPPEAEQPAEGYGMLRDTAC